MGFYRDQDEIEEANGFEKEIDTIEPKKTETEKEEEENEFPRT